MCQQQVQGIGQGINSRPEHNTNCIPVNRGNQAVEHGRKRRYESRYLRPDIIPTDKFRKFLYCLIDFLTNEFSDSFPVPSCKQFFQLIGKITDSLVYTDSLKHI